MLIYYLELMVTQPNLFATINLSLNMRWWLYLSCEVRLILSRASAEVRRAVYLTLMTLMGSSILGRNTSTVLIYFYFIFYFYQCLLM